MPLIVRVVIVIGFFSGVVAIVATAGWLPYPAGGFPDVVRQDGRPSAGFWTSNALAQQTAAPPAVAICGRCGIVEASRTVVTDSEGEIMPSAENRAIGSPIGLQAGGGRAVGMLVGAATGVAVGKEMTAGTRNEVTVRLGDGSIMVVREKHAARWEPGDRVKVVDGVLRRN